MPLTTTKVSLLNGDKFSPLVRSACTVAVVLAVVKVRLLSVSRDAPAEILPDGIAENEVLTAVRS
ncbi:MAG: hypothetical protein BWX77_00887 [Bacteroidetes bacterium ADurb.Bin090]|nr:MAG: hypothetical protein BWX77_00887 [Bacteroidetes bacterium ADurb.Bin090]